MSASPAPVTAAVLIIGDEILSGRTADVNLNAIAKMLAQHGVDLKEARVVGDEKAVLIDVSADATRYASRGTAAATATAVDPYVDLVRLGYEAFNSGDVAGLQALLSRDVQQHVPGNSQISGEYKGLDAVLAYYGRLGELTDGTMRADLIEAHGDGRGHVLAVHQLSATRNGATRVSRGSILFTFLGEKATDLLELSQDQAGDDAFFA